MLEHVYSDLTTVTETHRMMSALRMLPSIVRALFDRKLYPEGPFRFLFARCGVALFAAGVLSVTATATVTATAARIAGFLTCVPSVRVRSFVLSGGAQLEAFLWSSLPGVDSVDVAKTCHTLLAYLPLFWMLPVVSAHNQQGADGQTDADQAAREATLCFPEWTEAFFDKYLKGLSLSFACFLLSLSCFPVLALVSSHRASLSLYFTVFFQQEKFAKKHAMDVALFGSCRSVSAAFFFALSPALHRARVRQLVHQATQQVAAAKKYFGTQNLRPTRTPFVLFSVDNVSCIAPPWP